MLPGGKENSAKKSLTTVNEHQLSFVLQHYQLSLIINYHYQLSFVLQQHISDVPDRLKKCY